MTYSVGQNSSNNKATNGVGVFKTKNESKEAVPANGSRTHLIVSNTGTKVISLGLGVTAVAGKGIVLQKESPPLLIPGWTGAVFAIATSEEPELAFVDY